MARVLKGCYFPRTNFLHASSSTSGSFLWKNLMWGRSLITKGLRWRVGNGNSILSYEDKWIPRPTNFKIIAPPLSFDFPIVSLLKSDSGGWDSIAMRAAFAPIDTEAILGIPPALPSMCDQVVKHYDISGRYSVKSGYFVGLSSVSNSSSSGLSGDEAWWKYL
ncbi:hypothetical protein ACOSP7_007959 [Xanthoceras sorbifolium]